MYLDEIIQWLEKSIENYNNHLESSLIIEEENTISNLENNVEINALIEFIEKFKFSEEVIDKFYLSALAGEYLNYEEYDTKLSRINNLIGECGGIFSEINNVIDNVKEIRSLITQYRHFILRISTKYSKPERAELFNSITDRDDSFFYETSNDEIVIKCGIFKEVILGISEIDHNLSLKADKDTFKDILYFHQRIIESKELGGPVKKLSKAKCNILLYKLAKRIEQDEKKYYYTHNLSDKEFEIDHHKTTYFNAFIEDVDLQYYDDLKNDQIKDKFSKFCSSVMQRFESQQNGDIQFSLTEAHALVKYHKDILQNGENILKEISDKVKPKIDSKELKFDHRAKIISYHYLLNNYFSYLALKEEDNHSIIINELKLIGQKQKTDDVENYFPYLRYSEYLINKLDSYFSEDMSETGKIKNFLEEFERNYKMLMVKYEWCYDRDFLAYMPSYNECIRQDTIDNQEYKLFIASSFVLPINYAQVKRQIDELYQKFTKYKLLLDVKLFQDKSNLELDNKIDKRTKEFGDIEERVKDSERKNIEILGIFAAIVLFTMSNIQIFTKIDYVKDAILFMLIMAYSMCLFIVVIWLITRDKGYFGKDDDYRAIINKTPTIHKVIISLLIIATLTSLIYTAPYFNSVKSDSREKKFEIIDSKIKKIEKQINKKDSLINKSIEKKPKK